ncbi:hypothetical protein [Streptomyces prasinopilosus]|uniref:Uncharacterized protein n=1 Tax=Streptomyces prasinopilosus TaxID=67344 RepID=A0A1G6MIJ8_9ACTN|nr:hypothetical protein [Streptomyces prasinopilosus]SDC55291.1 hypothetical protein SAMN05216505_102559 [Streptomyces prasinopilosus]
MHGDEEGVLVLPAARAAGAPVPTTRGSGGTGASAVVSVLDSAPAVVRAADRPKANHWNGEET